MVFVRLVDVVVVTRLFVWMVRVCLFYSMCRVHASERGGRGGGGGGGEGGGGDRTQIAIRRERDKRCLVHKNVIRLGKHI